MQNQKGEGTIWACVITIVVCMLLALFLTFFEALESVKSSKQAAKTVLNAMVTENAADVFTTLRDSENDTGQIAESLYIERLTAFAELSANGETLTKAKDGREVYSLSLPQITVEEEDSTLTVAYTLSVPLN